MDNLFMAPTPILWHIAGIGAQGGLLAQHFFHGRHEVQLILKNKAQLTTYQQSTLTLFKENTTFIASPSATTVDDLNHPIHHLICCTKAPDTVPLLMQLAPRLSHRSLIILIQNGIGVLDEIKEKLPQLRIILGISTMGSYLKKPFTVQAGLSGKIHLGRAIGHFSEEEEAIINRTFTLAQLSHQWEHDIYPIMWEKFALNCCINILTALFSCKNGELRYHE